MEEEHQGSRTPASVGFTSPTRSATPGERPSPAYRGVGAARDPDEPTRVAVLANLPTARVVEAGVLGTPPPSARPGDSDPGLVGVPASEPSTPAPAPATSGRALSADEIARRDAIRALAKAAAKHGIDADVKKQWWLGDAKGFAYVNQSGCYQIDGVDDVADFGEMRSQTHDRHVTCTASGLPLTPLAAASAPQAKCDRH